MTDDPRAAAFEQALTDEVLEQTLVASNLSGWWRKRDLYEMRAVLIAALLKAAPPAEGPTWQPTRELLIRADSYLSLLWHRFVPGNKKDADLTFNVERTIGDLRAAYTPPRDPAGKE